MLPGCEPGLCGITDVVIWSREQWGGFAMSITQPRRLGSGVDSLVLRVEAFGWVRCDGNILCGGFRHDAPQAIFGWQGRDVGHVCVVD